jgi:hypothetical protein
MAALRVGAGMGRRAGMISGSAFRIILVCAAALSLAACGGARRGPYVASQFTQVSAAEAFGVLPVGGPPIVSVIQKSYVNARSQDIILQTLSTVPGQNRLTISMFGPMPKEVGDDTVLPNPIDTIPELGVEVRRELPNVPMQMSPYYVQNKYGPFGYAMGRPAPGELCMYAWQRITQMTGPTTNLLFTPRGAVVVRMRICEAGASEASLLALMYGYVVNATFDTRMWNPYGSPVDPPKELGRAGAEPVVPTGLVAEPTVLEGATGPEPQVVAAPVRRARPARRAREAEETFEETQPQRDYSDYPSVPAPPGGG